MRHNFSARNSNKSRFYRAEALETRKLLTAIASGETISASIGAAAEVDEYTFNAGVGESIVVGAMETVTSSLTLRIQLISPTSVTLLNITGAIGNGGVVANVVAAGTYTLRISDNTGTNTGGYNVSMAKLAGAQLDGGDGGAVTSGQYRAGTLDIGDIDIFMINVNAGGALAANVGEFDAQALDFTMGIFGPTGTQLFLGNGAATVSTTLTNVASSGTYYIVVMDTNVNASGTYNFTAVSIPGSQPTDADSGPLTSGVRRTGTFEAGDFDVYTVFAPAGGTLVYSFAETITDAAFAPTVHLFAPSGQLLHTDIAAVGFARTIANTVAGSYTFVVFDQNTDADGSYAITAVLAPETQITDSDSGPTQSGQQRAGTIDPGDLDVYTINGTSGGSLVTVLAETATTTAAFGFLVISPTGTILENTNGAVGISSMQNTLATTGVYTVIVYESGGNESGGYALTVASIPSTPITDGDSAALTSGARRTGSLAFGDLDIYTIGASAGGSLLVTSSETITDTANVQSIIFSPTGALVDNDVGAIGNAQLINPTVAGTYTIVIIEQSGDQTTDYALTVVSNPDTQPTDADSGPTQSGAYKTGTIDEGDTDVYTITGNIGAQLLINVAELVSGAAWEPQIIVTSPTGAVLRNDNGAIAVTWLSGTLPATGTYTVMVFDSGGDETGTYGLTLVSIGGSTPIVDADSGPVASGVTRAGSYISGDIDLYTASISLGSSMLVNVAEPTATNASPSLVIFDPTGKAIFNSAGVLGLDSLVSEVTLSGIYTMAVFEQAGDVNGSYNITAVIGDATQPVDSDSATLSGAEYRRGDIDPADIDVYTIQGIQGSSLLITVTESIYLGSAGTGAISLYVFSPTGEVLEATNSAVGRAVAINSLPSTGTYTIAVSEDNADQAMVYGLSAISYNANPTLTGDSGALVSGVTRRGHIDYGDMDVFTINAAQGQSIALTLADVAQDGFTPQLFVISPTGTLVSNVAATNGTISVQNAITTAGVYKYIVFEQNADAVGDYALTASITGTTQPTTGDSGPLVLNTPRAGSVTLGDLDIYTYNASQGVNFSVNAGETAASANYASRVLVYRPDGTIFADQTFASSGTTNVTNVVTGTYTIVIMDGSADATGSYSIAIGAAIGTDTVTPTFELGDYRFDAIRPDVVLFASEDLGTTFQLADITITNLTTNTVIPNPNLAFSYNDQTARAVITPSQLPNGIFTDGNYRLTINAGSVTDLSGNGLASNYNFDFFVLAGDFNRDRTVNFNDLLVIAQNYNRIGRSFSQGNIDYSPEGLVAFNDLLGVAQNYGDSVLMSANSSVRSTRFSSDRMIELLD